jgi:hypothetical protein
VQAHDRQPSPLLASLSRNPQRLAALGVQRLASFGSPSLLCPRSRLAAQESSLDNLSSLSMSLECKSRGIRFRNELVARQVFFMNRFTDDKSWWRLHDQMNELCVKLGYEGFLTKVMQENEMRERIMLSREDSAERRDEAEDKLKIEDKLSLACRIEPANLAVVTVGQILVPGKGEVAMK